MFKDPIEPGVPPVPVDQSGYFDHTPQSLGSDFRRRAITMLEQMGISVEFSHHEGAPGPAGDRSALRRRAVHRGQHHDLPGGGEGGGPVPGHSRVLHAEAVHRAPGLRDAHPHVAVRGRQQRVLRGQRRASPVEGRPLLHRRAAPARGRDHRGHQPVGQLLQATGGRRRGPELHLLGPQQPLSAGPGSDVQAEQGILGPGGAAIHRLGGQSRTWPSR